MKSTSSDSAKSAQVNQRLAESYEPPSEPENSEAFQNSKGKCVHFPNCRHLGRKVAAIFVPWNSNKELFACECFDRIHCRRTYLVGTDRKLHNSHTCPFFDTSVMQVRGCDICVGA